MALVMRIDDEHTITDLIVCDGNIHTQNQHDRGSHVRCSGAHLTLFA
jgi:hypothetical protein